MLKQMFAGEKRRAHRVPVSMQVEESSGGRAIGFGYAKNISEDGLAVDAQALIEGSRIPAVGSQVRMRFKLPETDLVITAHAKVIRTDPDPGAPRIAMQFVGLDPDFRAAISRFVTLQNRQ